LKKINVGITGYKGFIGYFLTQYINHLDYELNFIPCSNNFFDDTKKLNNFVKNCDVIVHLAAMNRGKVSDLYQTNVSLVKKLTTALEATDFRKKIIFSSSTQEKNKNYYGKSKSDGHKIFKKWAEKSGGHLNTLIIPNVYGPFCKPFYNSVIATFCFQLINDKTPKIEINSMVSLIYVQNLIEKIIHLIKKNNKNQKIHIKSDKQAKVSDILSKLTSYKKNYLELGIIPDLANDFDLNLFNTFRSYIDNNHLLKHLELNKDNRGYLFEVVKELNGGQTFFSYTKPGITRGNHFHTKKIERFCVVSGKAKICIRKIGYSKISEFEVSGKNPVVIDIPVFHTHNIKNISNDELLTLFWANEIYDQNNPDTYFKEV